MHFFTKLVSFFKENRKDVLYIISILLSSYFFFYKLGQSSLVSWDEAWYAEVARNIIKTGNPIELVWNGKPFFDHPPFGYALVAISFLVLGVSEFSANLPAATLGVSTLIALFLLGKKLFNPEVGLLSSIALLSSPWFLLRARSTNLEITLTFLFVLSVYLILKTIENKKYKYVLTISLASLFLTKTLIPFAIIPLILFFIITSKKGERKSLIFALVISLAIFIAWFLQRYFSHGVNFVNRYIAIGTPGINLDSTLKDNLLLMKDYIYFGLGGRWFWPTLGALIAGLLFRQKRFLVSFIFISVFLLPFVFSEKGHIWHYIPIFPFLLLNLMGFSYVVLEKFKLKKIIILLILFGLVGTLSFKQIVKNYNEFINVNAYTSDEEILSREAGKFEEPFLIDENFGPAAIFYSGKNVRQVSDPELSGLFENEPEFVLITFPWRLERSKIDKGQYEIIKADRDKILIVKKND